MVHDGHPPRQIWYTPSRSVITKTLATTTASAISQAQSALCTVALPSGGIIRFNDSYSTILSDSITFESSCGNTGIHGCQNSGNSTVVNFDDPFYASVAPHIYALATATIVSYMLVILIFITPRTFYVGGPGGGAGFLGLRNIVPGSGSSNVVGVGRRPLLQKIAAVTVAISLTIATADTFEVAKGQYNDGLMDSQRLVEDVIGSVEIRVIRVVSDTFLWLAQVQTLIRLFPRHKEKVTIKWLGFALVTCDTVFSILQNFVSHTALTRPRSFQDAIPALSYLFQMAISLIYASCVIYYSLAKRRFAFWHSKMKNICLVAILSLASVLVPLVFFVLDVSQPNIASWGEYIQWVGAAAASVVVWEWVERIETLERDERKDGILGREIFDGDEMLDTTGDHKSSSTSSYFGFGRRTNPDDNKRVSMMPIPSMRHRMPFRQKKLAKHDTERVRTINIGENEIHAVNGSVARPPQAATPISRSNTTSAASTVYAVRYQNVSSPSPAIPEEPGEAEPRTRQPSVQMNGRVPPIQETESSTLASNAKEDTSQAREDGEQGIRDTVRSRQVWQAVANPFKRKRTEPPAEVAAQMTASNARRSPAEHYHNVRERIDAFRATQRARLGVRQRSGPSPPMPVTVIPAQPRSSRLEVPAEDSRSSSPRRSLRSSLGRGSNSRREDLPVTVIPAPTRGGRTWSPDDLRDDGQQAQAQLQRQSPPAGTADSQNQAQGTPGPSNQFDASVHVARGALTIMESPTRAREHNNRNSSGSQRQYSRLRAPIIDPLNDRLSSTSPGSAAAKSPGSNSNGGALQRQSPTKNDSSQPPPDQPSPPSPRNSPPDRPAPGEGRS